MTYQEYYKQIQAIVADEIAELNEDGESRDYDETVEAVEQTIDQHEYIIYYSKALEVLKHSSNWTAIDDVGMELAKDFSTIVTQAAYFAMCQDCYELLEEVA